MIALSITILLSFASSSFCYPRQEITFYSERNNTGINFTLTEVKRPRNFSNLVPKTLGVPKSLCYTGRWQFYSNENYNAQNQPTGYMEWFSTYGSHYYRTCGSLYWTSRDEWMRYHTGSVRYVGPANPLQESISFYSNKDFTGIELIIQRAAFSNLPFTPQSMLITGHSNWTFYTGNNFDGNSTCFISDSYFGDTAFQDFNSTWSSTKSVLKGCDSSGFGATFLPNAIGGQKVLF